MATSAAPTPIPGTLKLQTNVPEVIALAFADGRPVQSQYSGDQVMYTLADGRKWYVPPAVASQLAQQGIGANTPFEVCKRELTIGNRRTLRHEFRPINGSGVAVSQTATPVVPNAVSPGSRPPSLPDIQDQAAQTHNTQPHPNRAQAQAIAAELAQELGMVPPTPPPPASAVPAGSGEPGGRLMACYRQAIDLAASAQRYAREKHGILIEPRFEDVRAAAAVLFIEAGRRSL